MIELRCRGCNRLLMKEDVRNGSIEIKCPSCGTFNYIERTTVIRKRTIEVLDKNEYNIYTEENM